MTRLVIYIVCDPKVGMGIQCAIQCREDTPDSHEETEKLIADKLAEHIQGTCSDLVRELKKLGMLKEAVASHPFTISTDGIIIKGSNNATEHTTEQAEESDTKHHTDDSDRKPDGDDRGSEEGQAFCV